MNEKKPTFINLPMPTDWSDKRCQAAALQVSMLSQALDMLMKRAGNLSIGILPVQDMTYAMMLSLMGIAVIFARDLKMGEKAFGEFAAGLYADTRDIVDNPKGEQQ